MHTDPHSEFVQTLIALALVSFASFAGSVIFVLGRRMQAAIPYLVGSAAGALLGSALFSLLPEALEHSTSNKRTGLLLSVGFLFSFLLERIFCLAFEAERIESVNFLEVAVGQTTGFHQAYEMKRAFGNPLVANVLLSGAVHSLVDGIGIAVAFSASHTAGVATTTAVLLHEVPHHIADVGVMIASGMSKMRAITLNFLATSGCATGGVLALLFSFKGDALTSALLPLTAANFLYIAVGMLMPELQREKDRRRSVLQITALMLTLVVVGVISTTVPG